MVANALQMSACVAAERHRPARVPAQHQRHLTGARAVRQHLGALCAMKLTLERHGLAAEHRHDDLQRLRIALHRLAGRVAELTGPTAAVTGAEPENEAPARDLVERLRG